MIPLKAKRDYIRWGSNATSEIRPLDRGADLAGCRGLRRCETLGRLSPQTRLFQPIETEDMATSAIRNPQDSRNRLARILWLCAIGLGLCQAAVMHGAENPTLVIKVDQVGYPAAGPKIAIVSAKDKTFEIRRSGDGAVVFRGQLGPAAPDPLTGDTVQAADFSALREPGRYYVNVPGAGRSWNFTVGDNVYQHAYFLAMRAFYGQRCGIAVDLGPEFPGYSHPACHLHGEFHPSSGASGPRDNIGGWHDAGDYGRYVVNSGIATATLLWTWEIYGPRLKPIALQIPESGNGAPDILNEARWNIEWMLKMQDTDGGVWHKQTSVALLRLHRSRRR